MNRQLKIIIIMVISYSIGYALPNDKYLNEYIKIGLKNNLELQSSKSGLEVYDARVNQAFSNFLPSIDITSRYTRAGGGRNFTFPLGDMMNPLYEALNLSTRFSNEEVSFIRPQEQDSKIELIQPIFNLGIINNYKAQDAQYEASAYDYQAKESGLIYNIKEAYYNYIKALQLVEIRKGAASLAKENYEVTKKLYDVDKAPKTDLLRSEVLMFSTEQELQSSVNMANMAKNMFNKEINRDFDAKVEYDSLSIEDLRHNTQGTRLEMVDLRLEKDGIDNAMRLRPEIKQLEMQMKSIEHAGNAISSDYLPSLALVADYGIQGEKYDFDKQSRYWMVSGMFTWKLFSGFGTKAKVQEMDAQRSSLEKMLESTKQLISLEVKNNYIDLRNNIEMLTVAEKALNSAEENYTMNKRRYEEGLNPYISLLDAQNTFFSSQSNYVITYFNILTSKAKLEKSVGQLTINN